MEAIWRNMHKGHASQGKMFKGVSYGICKNIYKLDRHMQAFVWSCAFKYEQFKLLKAGLKISPKPRYYS